VRADKVTIAGELEGNIEGATRVELQPSAVVTGDIQAGTVTVASGARMRGQAVFGWEEGAGKNGSKRTDAN
jgi:cytoskeletal protein CcmA (bactofilin family)